MEMKVDRDVFELMACGRYAKLNPSLSKVELEFFVKGALFAFDYFKGGMIEANKNLEIKKLQTSKEGSYKDFKSEDDSAKLNGQHVL